MKTFFCAVITVWALTAPYALKAQYSENLASDRPGATYSANTVGQWVFQVQTGADVGRVTYTELGFKNELNESLDAKIWVESFSTATDLRIGVYKTAEVGFTLLSRTQRQENDLKAEDLLYSVGGEPVYAYVPSLRVSVINNKQFQLGLMTSFLYDEDEDGAGIGRIMGSYALSSKTAISANISYTTYSNSTTPDFLGYTLNFSQAIGAFSVFVENYGSFIIRTKEDPFDNDFDFFFNAGAAYLLNPNFQLDVTFNGGINQTLFFSPDARAQQLGASLGLTWRLAPFRD